MIRLTIVVGMDYSKDPSKSQNTSLSSLRRKALVHILRTWREVQSTANHKIYGHIRSSVPKEDTTYLRQKMHDCLDSKGGEISARANTAELGEIYLSLNELGKLRFLKMLAKEFDSNSEDVLAKAKIYQKAKTPAEKENAEYALRKSLITPRNHILKQFTALPEGFKFLVDLRADLLPLAPKNAQLQGLERDLKEILSSWFDIGLLDLEQITWNSPASLLERLIVYEAVHQIESWNDLKNRLDSDRRVYAFFHNKMPLEPLIFVQVAFVKGLAGNIQELLNVDAPADDIMEADTAIFYSISNAQRGLAGISFGNFLIKRVVSNISEGVPQIKTFATLSPVPGFRSWLDPALESEEEILLPNEAIVITKYSSQQNASKGLLEILEGNWASDKLLAEDLKPILLRLCTHYLLKIKRKKRPHDPVANFHLFNGARLERINWLADTSEKGLRQAAGIMVNYHYKLSEIDQNHENFVTDGKIVAGRQVKGYV